MGALLDALRFDSGPPLFYLIEKPFVFAAESLGLSDNVLRIPAFIAVLAASVIGLMFRGRAERRCYVALAAASPFFLLYSAEARAYGLLLLLDAGVFLLLLRGPETRRRLFAGALWTAAALSTHYLALIFVASAAAVLLVRRRWRSLAALAAGAVTFAPWIPLLLRQPVEATGWIREGALASASGFASALGGAGRLAPNFGVWIPGLLVGAGAIAGLAAAWTVWRARDPDTRAAVSVVFLTLGALVAASWIRPAAFAGRSEMAVLGVWVWALASAAGTARRARWAVGAVLAVSACTTALVIATPPPRPSAPVAVEALARRVRPADRVIAGAPFYLPARLAADRGQLTARLEAYPSELAMHPGWFLERAPPVAETAAVERTLRSGAGTDARGRTYLLLHPSQLSRELARALTSQGVARELVRTPDVLLIEWIASPVAGRASDLSRDGEQGHPE